MKTHDFVQGSPEWLTYRLDHDNASEAAAMLGLSKTTTRSELLHAKHTGIGKEFSGWVQRNVLDYGHEVEARVRPLVEAMLGEDLYPMTCSDGRLSASLDGLTIGEDIAFECKQWNAEISAQVAAGVMPEQHMPQCQQILMVTGAGKLIFAVGDGTPENLLTLDVYPDHAWFERIRAGWAQFAIDLAAYVPVAPVAAAVAAVVESLPAVVVQVQGELVVASNLTEFGTLLRAFIRRMPAKPATDQEFADTESACKALKKAEDALEAAETSSLAQLCSVEEMRRMVADLRTLARTTRLTSEKLVAAQKDAIRLDIVSRGRAALAAHVDALNVRLGKTYMPAVSADFAGAVKGKKTLASLNNAVDTLLANTKIEASATADRIQANLTTLRELASAHAFLFFDAAQIVLKAPDDLTALIKLRIAEHQAAEDKKAEELRECIRKEEQARQAEIAGAELLRRTAQAEPVAELLPEIITPLAPEPEILLLSDMARCCEKAAFLGVVVCPDCAEISEGFQSAMFLRPTEEEIADGVVDAEVEPVKVRHPEAACIQVPAPAADGGATLRLGEINARLAPVTLTAEGLASLGFAPVATDKNAKLYRACDLQAIGAALVAHIASACQLQAA